MLTKIICRSMSSLKSIYDATIRKSSMLSDPVQLEAVDEFQRLNDDLLRTHSSWINKINWVTSQPPPTLQEKKKQAQKKNFFSFFSRDFSTSVTSPRIQGLYLWGGSGCGKSFLADMFYDNLNIAEKRRVHFHEFMTGIQAELFELQQKKLGYYPLEQVARKVSNNCRLLYLDEFQVTNVGDASILKRLFECMLDNELVLLGTSNRHPTDLYKRGHQREFFVPFIDFLQQRCRVKHLDSGRDYRYGLEKDETQRVPSYFSPVDAESEAKINELLKNLTGLSEPVFQPIELEPVPGRKLLIPRACGQVCLYDFNQLVDEVMGDVDFRIISKRFKAVVIRGMRQINRSERNTANRLIKLFDEAYFRHVKLYINGRVGINDIINAMNEKEATTEEDFAMIRCKSRLMEFQTKKYKNTPSYAQSQTL